MRKDTVKVYDQNSNDVTKGFENDINVIDNQGLQSLEINYKGFKKENYTVYYDLEITKELRDVIKVGTNRYLYNQVEFISKGKVICSNWAQIEVMNLPFLNTTLDKEIISSELYNHIGSELTYKLSIKGDQGNIKAVRAIDFAPKGTTIIPSSISVYQGGFGRQQIDVKVEKITSDNMVFKNATVVVDPEGKEIYVYIPETNYQNFYINYNLQVNAIYPSIENKVTVYSEGAKIVKQTIAKYEGTGGAIIAWKTSDKNIINNNGIINYKINLNSYGEFGSNYVNILDDLPKGLIIKNVNIEGAEKLKANYKNGVYNKVEGGFNISYGKSSDGSYFVNAYNSEIINNGDNIILNIEAVIGDLQKGTTISNTAIINGNATNTVDIKYGYRIKGEKVYKEKGLAGAIFNLYNGKGQFIEKIESDENGVIDFTVKEPNDYYLKEIKAPKGFQLKKEKFNFKVTENDVGTTINIGEIENEKVKIIKNYKVKLLKVDKDTNEGLEGAEFKLFDENNNYLKTLISNENGEIEFNLFKSGEYYLEEVKAPKGYRLNKEKLLFQIKENDKEIVDIGLIKNEKIKEENYYKVKGKKVVEESKRPLNGAVFELFTEGGNYIKRIESKDDGSIEFTVNKEGTYYLKEIKAPKGFYLNKDKLYFKVSAEDGNKEIDIGEIKNKAILPKVYK